MLDRPRVGIVPDLAVDVSLPPVGDTRRAQRGGQQWTPHLRRTQASRDPPRGVYLCDVKTLHGGGGLYFSARARTEQTGGVRERAHQVTLEYAAAARELDRRHSPQGTTPVATLLESFTTVRPLVFGHYGETSDDVHTLLERAASKAAEQRWRKLGARSQDEAKGFLLAGFRRRLGLAVAQAFARHRLRRLPFVGATPDGVQAARARDAAGGGLPDPGPGVRLDDFYVYQAHLPRGGA